MSRNKLADRNRESPGSRYFPARARIDRHAVRTTHNFSRALDLEDVEIPRTALWRVWHIDEVGDPDVLFSHCPATDPARIPNGTCYAKVDPAAEFIWKLGDGEADINILSRAAGSSPQAGRAQVCGSRWKTPECLAKERSAKTPNGSPVWRS